MKKSLRISILARDNFTCQYCGRRAPDVELHVDHIISRYDGGSNHPSNLAAACRDCNLGKSKRSLLIKEEVRPEAPKDPAFFLDFEPAPEPSISKVRPYKPLPKEYADRVLLSVDAAYNRVLQRELSSEWVDPEMTVMYWEEASCGSV